MQRHDVLIVGAGPVGLALALALKDSDLSIALADARPRDAALSDPRVLALAHGTRLTLERLGVWRGIPATPIRSIHVSQQGGFGRTRLEAADYGQPALGYVAPAAALAHALRAAVERAGISILDETEVGSIAPGQNSVRATLVDRRGSSSSTGDNICEAALVACGDGGVHSKADDLVERDYGQHALIGHVTVEGGHRETAFERFTPEGPLALLPCGERYALVHVVARHRADELLALDDAGYLAHLQERLGQRALLTAVTDRLRYPLVLRYRRVPVGPRTVWLGNAAQTLHPVAGQGFNLALRDVWDLAEILSRRGPDPGAADTLAAYARTRSLDRMAAIGFTDTLVRLFSNTSSPLRHMRGAALLALDTLPPLRHFLAKRMMFGARAWP